jgi:hypothetical protein
VAKRISTKLLLMSRLPQSGERPDRLAGPIFAFRFWAREDEKSSHHACRSCYRSRRHFANDAGGSRNQDANRGLQARLVTTTPRGAF